MPLQVRFLKHIGGDSWCVSGSLLNQTQFCEGAGGCGSDGLSESRTWPVKSLPLPPPLMNFEQVMLGLSALPLGKFLRQVVEAERIQPPFY